MIQLTPICFDCELPIYGEVVYSAPCGNDEHPTACFHYECCGRWHEKRRAHESRVQQWLMDHEKQEQARRAAAAGLN